MIPTIQRKFSWLFLLTVLICSLAAQATLAGNLVSWDSASSLIDTTNYTGVAPYYWFANFGNPTAVTGAPMNDHEARNLPSWIKVETRPICIGQDDGCGAGLADTTIRTGFSFEESATGAASNSTGGQTLFNNLTLPDTTSGISGLAVDPIPGLATTATMAQFRILPGAPSSFRMWVVTDNGTGPNFQAQARMRVRHVSTLGPPAYADNGAQNDAEALPLGKRLIEAGSDPRANNGTADAWAFRLDNVQLDDVVSVRPTSGSGARPAFAGIMIQVIPEPSSLLLVGLAAWGMTFFRRRGR